MLPSTRCYENSLFSPSCGSLHTTITNDDGWNPFDAEFSHTPAADNPIYQGEGYEAQEEPSFGNEDSVNKSYYNNSDYSHSQPRNNELQNRQIYPINNHPHRYIATDSWQMPKTCPELALDPDAGNRRDIENISSTSSQSMASRVYMESSGSTIVPRELMNNPTEGRSQSQPARHSPHTPALRAADTTRNYNFKAYSAQPAAKLNIPKGSRPPSSKHNEMEK